MKTLQIANGYLGSRLYSLLFRALTDYNVENSVYVPVKQGTENFKFIPESVVISPCFNWFDRCCFFSKQNKLLRDIETRKLLENIDIVHAHTVFSGGYVARKIYKKYEIPYIVAVRNTDVNLFFKKIFFMRPLGLKIMNDAKQIIFLSPAYLENMIQSFIPKKHRSNILTKSKVIPNGISPIFFQNRVVEKQKNNDKIRLIYVGELSTNKNFETTVEAAKILQNCGNTVEISVVGEIREEKYRALVEDNHMIKYYKKCPQSEVIQHLRQSDIFVMLSHFETFGLVYAEAMSQGLPVLYTRGQGFDGYFPDGTVGYSVSDSNPLELAEKIKAVVENYSELSRNCLDFVERFQWNQIAEQYSKIYDAVTKDVSR